MANPYDLLRQAPQASLVGFEIPEGVRQFVAGAQAPATPAPTLPSARDIDMDAFDAAMSADRKTAERNRFAENLNNAASQMLHTNRPAISLPPVDESMRAFVMRKQFGDAADDKAYARAEAKRKQAMEAAKFGLDVYKTGADVQKTQAETGKIGAEAGLLNRKTAPVTPSLRTMAEGLGLKVPDGATNQEVADLIDPALKAQGLSLDWSRLGLEREKFDFEKTKPGSPQQDFALKLRQELQGQQGYKDMQQVAAAYRKIQGTSDTGAGDISLIYGYMKLVDPGSTVREGEFATAANAGAVPDRAIGWYNRVLRGEKLPPEVRKQFKGEAGSVYNAQRAQYAQLEGQYRQLAQRAGVDPNAVVLDVSGVGSIPAPGASDGPVRVTTVEEARALAPGTRFVDPNGVERVR